MLGNDARPVPKKPDEGIALSASRRRTLRATNELPADAPPREAVAGSAPWSEFLAP